MPPVRNAVRGQCSMGVKEKDIARIVGANRVHEWERSRLQMDETPGANSNDDDGPMRGNDLSCTI